MMKKTLITLSMALITHMGFSQNVGVGTSDPKAKLDISSTTSGLLIPRLTMQQRDAIPTNPPIENGMLIYQTDNTPGFYFYNGSSWIRTAVTSDITGTNSGTNTGDVTLGSFGSTPSANGASLNGQILTLQPADGSNPGGVSTAAQTFAGAKTFSELVTGSAGLTVTGTTNINASNNAVTNIGTGTSTGAVTIGGTGTQTISIGNGAANKTVNLGSSNGTSITTIRSGSGGVNINSAVNQPVNIGTGTSTGTVTIGGTGVQTISIGNGAANKTVNLGSSNGTSITTIRSGSGGVNINTDVNQPVNIGTGTSTGNVTIGNTTGNVNIPKLSGNALVATDASDNLVSIAAGTSGQVLTSQGASIPIWTTPTTGTVTNVTGSSPISVSNGTTTPTVSIADADANGTTKGAATFTAADFNATTGNISIDYANGQKATSSVAGFLTSTDWSTFNNKENTLTFSNGLTRSTNAITLGGALTGATTISGLSGTNKMSFTGTGVDAFNVDGTTLSVDATNDRVGIGTAAPTSTLHVSTANLTAATTTWNGAATAIFRGENNQIAIGSHNASPWPVFIQGRRDDNTARDLVINPAGGNVGIGTTSPSERLHVQGNTRISGLAGTGNRTVYADNNGVLVTSNVSPGSVTVPIGCSSVTTSTTTENFESSPNGWSLTAGTGAVRIGTAYSNCASAGSCISGSARGGSGALQFQLCANSCDNCVWAEKAYDFGTAGGSFSFWWKIGSETSYDFLLVFVDGVQQWGISGCSNTTWTQQTISGIGPGTHTIRFAFRTDVSNISFGGRAQVDDLVITKNDLTSACIETPQRTIRGNVNSDATVSSGGGFICTRPSTGIYTIKFVNGFSDTPTVVATQVGNGNTRDNALVYDITSTSFKVKVGDSGGDVSNRPFTFIAIGSQ